MTNLAASQKPVETTVFEAVYGHTAVASMFSFDDLREFVKGRVAARKAAGGAYRKDWLSSPRYAPTAHGSHIR